MSCVCCALCWWSVAVHGGQAAVKNCPPDATAASSCVSLARTSTRRPAVCDFAKLKTSPLGVAVHYNDHDDDDDDDASCCCCCEPCRQHNDHCTALQSVCTHSLSHSHMQRSLYTVTSSSCRAAAQAPNSFMDARRQYLVDSVNSTSACSSCTLTRHTPSLSLTHTESQNTMIANAVGKSRLKRGYSQQSKQYENNGLDY